MATTFIDRQPSLTALAAAVDAEPDALRRLHAIRRLRTTLLAVEGETVGAERASWAAVGAELGVSKQAASKRFWNPQGEINQRPAAGGTRMRPSRTGWEIAIPGRRALLHIRPRTQHDR